MSNKGDIEANVNRNLGRVKTLASIYKTKLAGTGSGRRPVNSADILRAATVMLHATLEDFLRDIARWKLPLANAEALNEIPIASSETKVFKFNLGYLTKFRGSSVDDIIKQSVIEYLGQATYNNVSDIKKLFTNIGQDTTKVDPYASDLGNMMERRHHIVHRADKNETTGVGHYSAKSIAHKTVKQWIDTVDKFTSDVLDDL